ncbi:MAG: hypothetical protein ACJ79Q_02070 [Gemmatimonadaceae bacterium]|jgi:hypothetical protein
MVRRNRRPSTGDVELPNAEASARDLSHGRLDRRTDRHWRLARLGGGEQGIRVRANDILWLAYRVELSSR